jgi:predicted phosphodiesterase
MVILTHITIFIKIEKMSFKLLVASDTHGRPDILGAVLAWAKGLPPAEAPLGAVFLGDGEDDIGPAREASGSTLEWKRVRGNMDHSGPVSLSAGYPASTPGKSFRLFLTHGHSYHVELGYGEIAAAARAENAQVVLYGHTHVPCFEFEANPLADGGLWFLNPGSLGRPRTRSGSSFALLSASPDDVLRAEFYTVIETRKGFSVKLLA